MVPVGGNSFGTWLILLKLLATLSTAIFAIIGVVGDRKDAQGRLTRWGKIAIGGVIISLGIAIATQILELRRDKIRGEEAAARMAEDVKRQEHILRGTIQISDSL